MRRGVQDPRPGPHRLRRPAVGSLRVARDVDPLRAHSSVGAASCVLVASALGAMQKKGASNTSNTTAPCRSHNRHRGGSTSRATRASRRRVVVADEGLGVRRSRSTPRPSSATTTCRRLAPGRPRRRSPPNTFVRWSCKLRTSSIAAVIANATRRGSANAYCLYCLLPLCTIDI